jgi:hypothetical protein
VGEEREKWGQSCANFSISGYLGLKSEIFTCKYTYIKEK